MAADVGNVPFSPKNIAALWHLGGCSVLPIKDDGSKAPALLKWKQYQTQQPIDNVVRYWFEEMGFEDPNHPHNYGVGVICGSISGNLEMLELEGRANNQESLSRIISRCKDLGIIDIWNRLVYDGYTELTPGGGLHLIYRIADHPVPRNYKVASRYALEDEYTVQEQEIRERQPTWSATRVLAETRGEGGYVIVAPSPGPCHPTGLPWVTVNGTPGQFLTITWVEREKIHAAVRSAINEIHNELALSDAPRPPKPERPNGVLSAVDDFEVKHSWEEDWFFEAGWQIHHREGNEIYWTRPGKDLSEGHSATTGYTPDGDRLYIWSTSTDLPSEQPLTKFFVYSHYRYNGDMSSCANNLRSRGYGTPLISPPEYQDFELGGVPEDLRNRPLQRHDLHSDEQNRPSGGILFTDVAYARRVADRYGKVIRFNTTEKRWYIWEPGEAAWTPDDIAKITQIVESIVDEACLAMSHALDLAAGNQALEKQAQLLLREAQKAMSHTRITAILNHFKAQPGISVEGSAFDMDLDLVNMQNGVLRLSTREVVAHDPKYMMTLTMGASYEPEATCPRFLQFMEEVLPDPDVRTYVQRALGYSLMGKPNERAMFMLHGPSGTGKSVLTGVMTGLFGGYGTTAPASTFRLKKNETTVDVHQLKGKRFVATSELPAGTQLDEELVKRITGGDIVVSRSLYESFSHWKARCVIWIGTNFLPKLSSDDNAIWRRVRTVAMKTEFGPHANTEIKGLAEMLLQERDGILNWLLDGLDSYKSSKGLAEPVAVTNDINGYRTDMDSVASWFRDATVEGDIIIDPEGRIHTQFLYQMYTAHCSETGFNPLGRIRFVKRLSGMAPNMKSEKIGGQMTWFGLRGLNGSL